MQKTRVVTRVQCDNSSIETEDTQKNMQSNKEAEFIELCPQKQCMTFFVAILSICQLLVTYAI